MDRRNSDPERGRDESEREMKPGYCYGEVLPFAVMVMVECADIGSATLYKAAVMKGMSYSVFVVYSYAVSTIVLLPLAFIFHRKTPLPPFDRYLFARICQLGVLGLSAQMLGYKGLVYASATLSSAMSSVTTACALILAVIFSMEKLAPKSSSTQAEIIGIILLISGAFVVIFYEGPAIITSISPSTSYNQLLTSLPSQSNWAAGALLLLAADYVVISIWYIIQAQTVRKYPAEFTVVFLFSLCITIMAIPVCLYVEPNLSAWIRLPSVAFASILYTGVVGAAIGAVAHIWALKVKGPVYVALFKPLSTGIAAAMGFTFLGEAFHLGSVVGAVGISVGFYVVMWGKAREEKGSIDGGRGVCSVESSLPSPEGVPLLQGQPLNKLASHQFGLGLLKTWFIFAC